MQHAYGTHVIFQLHVAILHQHAHLQLSWLDIVLVLHASPLSPPANAVCRDRVWFNQCSNAVIPHCHAPQAAGQQGDTAPPPPEQDVDLHFIAFVEHDGEPTLCTWSG